MRTLKKKLLSKTIGKNAFWALNKELVKQIGLESALIIQHIADLMEIFDIDEVFQSQPDMAEELGISEYAIKTRIPELIKLGLLNVVKKGVPCKNYYSTNDSRIFEIIANGLEDTKSTDLSVESNNELKSTDSDNENNGLVNTKSTDSEYEINSQSVSNQRTGDSEIVSTITNNTNKEYEKEYENNNTHEQYVTNKTLNNWSSEHNPNAFDDLIEKSLSNNILSESEINKCDEALEYFGRK